MAGDPTEPAADADADADADAWRAKTTAELSTPAAFAALKRARDARPRCAPAMRYLVPVRREFGDESEVFVSMCDAFTVLGGGEQSRREAELGLAQGKVVTLITGFGGAADSLAAEHQASPPPSLRVIAGR